MGEMMTEQTQAQKRSSAAYGRVILLMSLVWAATIMSAAVVDKASGEFIYLIFVLLGGFTASGAVLESGRRQMLDPTRS